jgi:acetyl-CoA carboxylase, biotin carboxylase subunit
MSTGVTKIKKVLVANRGEIALRVQRACDSLGIQSAIVASDPDSEGYVAREAHELIVIGGSSPADSYLNIPKVIQAAKDSGCDAVHPGYGFLSENPLFAQAVLDAGLCFVGPSPEAISKLGDKVAAREMAQSIGVPLVKGTVAGLSDDELLAKASEIGFPLMIKAVAGGGGRGIRVVHSADEMLDQLPRVRAEARKFFSNESVYIERFVSNPRHVEVQVLGDGYGKVLHFGTRDCSVQRRHQKLVEEAPAPFLSDTLREGLHNAAVKLARAAQYVNAGTVEFLVSGEEFFFLEMNTRIQVEHPVTEAVTGVDLVALQLKVADGQAIPFSQEDVAFNGHAVEFRVYAEDPLNGFAPSKGFLSVMAPPKYPWFREDASYQQGDKVSLFYDAMVSKCIVYGESRSEALVRARRLFNEYELSGITTSAPFHQWLLCQADFFCTVPDVGFIDRQFDQEKFQIWCNSISQSGKGSGLVESLKVLSNDSGLIELEVWHREDGLYAGRSRNANGDWNNWNQGILSTCRETIIDAFKAEVVC